MLPSLLLAALLAVTVRQDTALRSGCDPDDSVIAQLTAGETVQVRFALAGSSTPCYKIATATAAGYVRADLLDGLEQFIAERNRASLSVESVKITRVEVDTVQKQASAAVGTAGPLGGVAKLIDAGQPQAALAMLEPALQRPQPDPNALVLAGVAAWRGDDPNKALGYWRTALNLRPDPNLQKLYDKVCRETAGDRSGQRTIGTRVTLRYEGETVPPEVAREMLEALDSEYARISSQIGCRAEERITAIVQSRDAYLKTTGAAEWSGGQYDGRIRIALVDEGPSVGPRTRRAFAHELVHACLSSLGSWPSWFHEGFAQKFSGDRLSRDELDHLQRSIRAGEIPRLEKLAGSWAGLSPAQARAAYTVALRAADIFLEAYSTDGLRNLINTPARFPQVTEALNRRLELR